MKYLLMIYTDEGADSCQNGEAQRRVMDAYFAYTNQGREAGVILGGDALHPTSTATTVRVRDGKLLTTDGPFAETKEQLGGYYLVDCSNLDEAIDWARRIPGASTGCVEVRPIVDFSEWRSATS